MVGEFDSIGDAVTGGMVGRTFEAAHGEGDGHTHERNCLNCSAPLTGAYCARCGQKAHLHRTMGAFAHDLMHGVLHFDGKTWRTLPLLAWHPGRLTREYIDGKRARFVSPMALFLFSVFIMFAVLGASGALNFDGSGPATGSFDVAVKNQKELIATLEAKRQKSIGDAAKVKTLDERIASEKSDLKVIQSMRDKELPTVSGDGPAWIKEAYLKARKNPQLALYKIRTSAYKWSWALIPISAPFLWLLFPFSRRFRMYDHVIFVTYSLAFMNILVVTAVALTLLHLSALAGFLMVIPPLHFYRQLKEAYGLSRFGALWRALALTVFAMVALVLFGLLMIAVGVL